MSQIAEERATVSSLAVNQSCSFSSISVDEILDASNTTNLGHQWRHQNQSAAAEPTTRVSSNVLYSFMELPPEDRVFTTENSAVGTIASAVNTENSCRGPPPPYQGIVIEGDVAREIQSDITNVSYSIQEQPPAYQVSFTRDSELEVIENFTNTTY